MRKLLYTLPLMLISFTANAQLCPDDNHPHIIDLGLPSGTKWACCNMGADNPESYGDYYSWGEVMVKGYYSSGNYYRVQRGSDIAGTEYDVAHVKWGDSWVMPSSKQIDELINNCIYELTTVNGVIGGKFFSNATGCSIFLPAAGFRSESELIDDRTHGWYWSSTHTMDGAARILYFHNQGRANNWSYHTFGLSVRPIYKSNGFVTENPKFRIYDKAEINSEFPGGEEAFTAWLKNNLRYPPVAADNHIQGSVIVTFVVEKDGSITNPQIAKGVDPSLDKEAFRLVKAMPKWIPGRQNNELVRTKKVVTIPFKLD